MRQKTASSSVGSHNTLISHQLLAIISIKFKQEKHREQEKHTGAGGSRGEQGGAGGSKRSHTGAGGAGGSRGAGGE
jgi:hypothetical protein